MVGKRLRKHLTWKRGAIGGGLLGAALITAVLLLPGCLPPEMDEAAEAMAHLPRQSYSASLTGGAFEVSYVASGDPTGPRVILIHGTPGAADNWGFLLADPPAGMEVVAVDRPGFGQTTPKREVVRLDDHARAIAPLLVERRGVKPVVVGHSYGGPVAARLAVDYPDRVGGLVLAAAALDPDLEDIYWYQHVGEWAAVSWLVPEPLRHCNREILALEEELRTLAPRLAAVGVPVEIVHGTDDDLVPYANVAFMQRAFSGAPVRVDRLDGANHFLPWLHVDALRSAIMRVVDAQSGGATQPAP
ncbi:MAG: alpha/beta fold hydrolase [Planctomycetota bacterium]